MPNLMEGYLFTIYPDHFFVQNVVGEGRMAGELGRGGWPSGKVLDSQPRNRGLESRHTLGFLCLKSLGKICTQSVS